MSKPPTNNRKSTTRSVFDLFDRVIAFHRIFVDLTGSILPALMLSQACYWQKVAGEEKWWYKTRRQWREETGMVRRQQERCRQILVEFDFWEEEPRGMPRRMHFRVNSEALVAALNLSGYDGVPTGRHDGVPTSGRDGVPADLTESTSETTTEISSREDGTIPAGLATPEFLEAYEEYKEHRREKRSKMTMKAHTRLMKKLARFGPATSIKAIHASIENGWTGVFPEREKPARGSMRAADEPSSSWVGYENVRRPNGSPD